MSTKQTQTHRTLCWPSGQERDDLLAEPTGTHIARYAALRFAGIRGPDNLPLFKPPYSRITAIDMNTGEHLWVIPAGETPERVLNHPELKDMNIPTTGTGSAPTLLVTDTLLMYASAASDGTPHLFAVDKATGKQVGKVEVGARVRYGMMTYVHEGKQYVVLQTGSLHTVLALPESG